MKKSKIMKEGSTIDMKRRHRCVFKDRLLRKSQLRKLKRLS